MLRHLIVLIALGCGPATPEFTEAETERILRSSPLAAPPPDPTNAVADDPAAARLGQWLYFDTGLSGTGEQSCATCHDPELGFADGLGLSQGIGTTARGAPTILNSAFNRWYFWDGRTDSAWAQALGPIESPVEMGGSRLEVAHRIAGDPELSAAYTAVFGALPDLSDATRFPSEGRPVPDQVDDPHAIAWSSMTEADQDAVNRVFSNVGKAIAAYERLLVRGDAPWDRFVAGLAADDPDLMEAISPEAQRGAQIAFSDREGACHNCHESPTFSDLEFQNIGLATRDGLDPADVGRYGGVPKVLADPFNGMGPYSDDPEGAGATKLQFLALGDELIGQFKTSTLRNVADTAPYMHGGHFETLKEVVRFYNELDEEPEFGHREHLMQPLELGNRDESALVAFLESLTGAPLDDALMQAPPTP